MRRVQVLLACHNGERYLAEQLHSIRQQVDVDVDVVILDDHSADGTGAIIDSFADLMAIRVVRERDRLGLPGTYLRLLQVADAERDCWAFADQDDVWLPDKLRHAVEAISQAPACDPVLWFCDYEFLTGEPWTSRGPRAIARTDASNALVEGARPGCCMVWNRALMDAVVVPESSAVVMHDSWLYLSAALLGEVIHTPFPLVQYRLHDGNAIGVDTSLLGRLRRHATSKARGNASFELQAAAALAAYGDRMDAGSYRAAVALAKSDKAGILRAWLAGDLRRNSYSDNILLLPRLLFMSLRAEGEVSVTGPVAQQCDEPSGTALRPNLDGGVPA
jgi:rhamnosyltransferase